MSRKAFEEKYAQLWADTPPHVRKLWIEAWQAATSRQEARVRELEEALEWVLCDYEGIGAAGLPPCANWNRRVEKARKALSTTGES